MTINPTLALSQPHDFVIANGESLTEDINLAGNVLVGIYIPVGFTGTTISFAISADGVTWFNMYVADGTEALATVAPGRYVTLDSNSFLGGRWLRVRSGPSAAPTNQSGDSTITLSLGRPVV